jgi:chaperone modulatory protein CbpM
MPADDVVKAEEIVELTFEELCSACQVPADFVIELISYGTIEPRGNSPQAWRFEARQIHVIRTAIRLHEDLDVNHAGIALAMDLFKQVEELREQLDLLEKYFSVTVKDLKGK